MVPHNYILWIIIAHLTTPMWRWRRQKETEQFCHMEMKQQHHIIMLCYAVAVVFVIVAIFILRCLWWWCCIEEKSTADYVSGG